MKLEVDNGPGFLFAAAAIAGVLYAIVGCGEASRTEKSPQETFNVESEVLARLQSELNKTNSALIGLVQARSEAEFDGDSGYVGRTAETLQQLETQSKKLAEQVESQKQRVADARDKLGL